VSFNLFKKNKNLNVFSVFILHNKNKVFIFHFYIFVYFGCKFEVWRKKTHLILFQVRFFFIIISFIFFIFYFLFCFFIFVNFYFKIIYCISLSLFYLHSTALMYCNSDDNW